MILLETENLIEKFGGLIATDDVNFTVEEDERVSIIEPNGTGRSMLISLITQRLGPTSDNIRFKSELTIGLEPHQTIQCGVSKSFQTVSIFPNLTVRENAEIATLTAEHDAFGFELLRYRDSLTDVHGVARDALDSVGLLDRADTITADFPYGNKHRLEIGITLASEPDLPLMNGPTAGMSPEEMKSAVDLVKRVKRDHGLASVLAEHDMEIVFSISDHTTVLSRGGIIAEGTPGEIRGNEAVQKTYLGGVELWVFSESMPSTSTMTRATSSTTSR